MRGLFTPAEFAIKVHLEFRRMVMRPEFSCLGAKAAFNENTYAFGVFDEMGTKQATEQLSKKLSGFARSPIINENEFSSFAAIFRGPPKEVRQLILHKASAASHLRRRCAFQRQTRAY